MGSSLQTAVLGMRAYQEMLNVTGNNIANADTVAFKEDRITFSEMFARTVSKATRSTALVGGTNPIQIGMGTRVSSVDANMAQGNFTATEKDFDLAIDGEGFFVVDDGARSLYTRDGTFDVDPMWQGNGNQAEFAERVARPDHDFGFVPHAQDGSRGGTLGGTIWRDERPSYYADRIGPLSLDDELYAEGTVQFVAAGVDSAVYLGWFDDHSKQNKKRPEYEEHQRNYLGILLEGPSRVGHYFRPGYGTAGGSGSNAEQGPILRTDARRHSWSMRYDPKARGGRGQIVVTLDDQQARLNLGEHDRARGATFDRFGLFNMQSGGWHVEVYFDDLRYTASGTEDAQ